MINKFIALSIAHNFEKEAFRHLVPAILLYEYDPWSIGTPVIADNRYIGSKGLNINCLLLMTTSSVTGGAGYIISPSVETIKPFGNQSLIKDHKVVEIDFFDPAKTQNLIEYVRDVGSITLCILGEVGQRSFPTDLRHLVNEYKFHTNTYFNSWLSMGKHLKNKKDVKFTMINIFNLPYCIPIFNNKKVDGIGISYNIVTKGASIEYGQPHRLAQLDIMLSNHDENLFIVDGSIRCDPWEYTSDIQMEMERTAEHKLTVISEAELRKMKSVKSPKLRVKSKNKAGEWVEKSYSDKIAEVKQTSYRNYGTVSTGMLKGKAYMTGASPTVRGSKSSIEEASEPPNWGHYEGKQQVPYPEDDVPTVEAVNHPSHEDEVPNGHLNLSGHSDLISAFGENEDSEVDDSDEDIEDAEIEQDEQEDQEHSLNEIVWETPTNEVTFGSTSHTFYTTNNGIANISNTDEEE